MSKAAVNDSDRRLSEFGGAQSVEIENVVASTALGMDLSLPELAQRLPGAEYNPERFPGVVMRMESPKAAALIFRSGKMVCTGAKSVEDVTLGLRRVFEEMRSIGVPLGEDPLITVQNIVASGDLHAELDLDAVSIGIGLENVEYEPEMFPGLVYRLGIPKIVVLLFGSGKMIITGAKKIEDCERAMGRIVEELSSLNLLGRRTGAAHVPTA